MSKKYSLGLALAMVAGIALALYVTHPHSCTADDTTAWLAPLPGPAFADDSASRSPELSIRITEPRGGSKVAERCLVRGTVSDPKAKVWVLVHPLMWADYYVQPATTAASDGTWKVMVYIGKGDQGVGELFDIRALANPRGPLKQGDILHNWPDAEASSDPVEVKRQ